MKTLVLLTLTIAAMLLVVAPALADEPQVAPQTESQALSPLPENIRTLLTKDGVLLDMVLDLSFAPSVVSAKLYFRTNDEAATAFWVQVLVDVTGSTVNFPSALDENTVLGVRQINSGGAREEWVNEPLLERLAEKLLRKKQPEKEKVKYAL